MRIPLLLLLLSARPHLRAMHLSSPVKWELTVSSFVHQELHGLRMVYSPEADLDFQIPLFGSTRWSCRLKPESADETLRMRSLRCTDTVHAGLVVSTQAVVEFGVDADAVDLIVCDGSGDGGADPCFTLVLQGMEKY